MMTRLWMLAGLLAVASVAFTCTPPPPAPASARETRWLGYFSSGYSEARKRFRENCGRHLASPDDFCRSFRVASPTDKDLTIDYGFFHRDGDRLLVIQSGIHG